MCFSFEDKNRGLESCLYGLNQGTSASWVLAAKGKRTGQMEKLLIMIQAWDINLNLVIKGLSSEVDKVGYEVLHIMQGP